MYDSPKLIRVGEAQNVILGLVPSGDDLDTYDIIHDFEYADDQEYLDSKS